MIKQIKCVQSATVWVSEYGLCIRFQFNAELLWVVFDATIPALKNVSFPRVKWVADGDKLACWQASPLRDRGQAPQRDTRQALLKVNLLPHCLWAPVFFFCLFGFLSTGTSFITVAYAQKGLEMCTRHFLIMNWDLYIFLNLTRKCAYI